MNKIKQVTQIDLDLDLQGLFTHLQVEDHHHHISIFV